MTNNYCSCKRLPCLVTVCDKNENLRQFIKHINYQIILETKHKISLVPNSIIKHTKYQTILEAKHKPSWVSFSILEHTEYQTILEIKIVTRTGYTICLFLLSILSVYLNFETNNLSDSLENYKFYFNLLLKLKNQK